METKDLGKENYNPNETQPLEEDNLKNVSLGHLALAMGNLNINGDPNDSTYYSITEISSTLSFTENIALDEKEEEPNSIECTPVQGDVSIVKSGELRLDDTIPAVCDQLDQASVGPINYLDDTFNIPIVTPRKVRYSSECCLIDFNTTFGSVKHDMIKECEDENAPGVNQVTPTIKEAYEKEELLTTPDLSCLPNTSDRVLNAIFQDIQENCPIQQKDMTTGANNLNVTFELEVVEDKSPSSQEIHTERDNAESTQKPSTKISIIIPVSHDSSNQEVSISINSEQSGMDTPNKPQQAEECNVKINSVEDGSKSSNNLEVQENMFGSKNSSNQEEDLLMDSYHLNTTRMMGICSESVSIPNETEVVNVSPNLGDADPATNNQQENEKPIITTALTQMELNIPANMHQTPERLIPSHLRIARRSYMGLSPTIMSDTCYESEDQLLMINRLQQKNSKLQMYLLELESSIIRKDMEINRLRNTVTDGKQSNAARDESLEEALKQEIQLLRSTLEESIKAKHGLEFQLYKAHQRLQEMEEMSCNKKENEKLLADIKRSEKTFKTKERSWKAKLLSSENRCMELDMEMTRLEKLNLAAKEREMKMKECLDKQNERFEYFADGYMKFKAHAKEQIEAANAEILRLKQELQKKDKPATLMSTRSLPRRK